MGQGQAARGASGPSPATWVQLWPWPSWEMSHNSFQPSSHPELLLNLDFVLGGKLWIVSQWLGWVFKLVPGRAVSAQGTHKAGLILVAHSTHD